jgi:hypothetical protein
MDLEPERLLAALRKILIGHVALPQERGKTGQATNDSTAAGLYLRATVPDRLIRALERRAD